jgi:arabinofuranosyltransferase
MALFVGCATVHVVYVSRVGGDYLHGRFLVPSFFAICAPVAAVAVCRRHLLALAVVPWVVVALLVLRPLQYGNWIVGYVVLPERAGIVTLEDAGWAPEAGRAQWYSGPGYYRQISMGRFVRDDDVLLSPELAESVGTFGGIGAVGYYLGPELYIFDAHGLAEVITSHLEPQTEPTEFRLAGHEKKSPPAWSAAQLTDEASPLREISFQINPGEGFVGRPDEVFAEDVEWARRALECGPIERLLDSTRETLTAGRFLRNLGNSFANTRLRIPVEPERAVRALCEANVTP